MRFNNAFNRIMRIPSGNWGGRKRQRRPAQFEGALPPGKVTKPRNRKLTLRRFEPDRKLSVMVLLISLTMFISTVTAIVVMWVIR
ncbi:hypothetical protein OAU50_04680 [Planctomycetota bacterium]|nr:hypothetical protein [Planctomycetota bacterium]